MSANLPEALFTVRLRPLADRLDANQALATATAIHETPSVLTDPRLEDALLEATYVAPSTRLLLAWPDGSVHAKMRYFDRKPSLISWFVVVTLTTWS